MFDLADGFAFNQQIEQFIRDWQDVPGEKYTSTSTLPPGLTPDEAELAFLEIKSIPEVFYNHTQLPVIRPSNVRFLSTRCPNTQVASHFGLGARALPD